MNERMKNMKKIAIMIMAVALVALPTMAQSFGEQEQPTAAFQSTSTMTPSGSAYSANPSLNENGVATTPSAARAGSGPKKAAAGSLPLMPETSDGGNQPIGDAVLPLTLMALAFCGVIALRRRKVKASR